MSWHGKDSRINIREIITVSMGILISYSMCYLYFNYYLNKVFTTSKHFRPAISKLKTDAYTDDWIKKMEEKYRQDNKRIRKICNEHRIEPLFASNNNDKKNKAIVMHWPIDVTHRLAYCGNGKVAIYFYIGLI